MKWIRRMKLELIIKMRMIKIDQVMRKMKRIKLIISNFRGHRFMREKLNDFILIVDVSSKIIIKNKEFSKKIENTS